MSSGIDQNSQTHRARCVIWRAIDATVPVALSGALERRGISAVECDNACWAMAELCRMHCEETDTSVILLLLNPDGLQDVEQVLALAEQYAPHASVWTYVADRTPPLQVLTRSAQVRRPGKTESEPTHGQSEPSVGLRLIDVPEQEEEAKPDNPSAGCQTGQNSPSILSRDELASLKHPDRVTDPDA
ncbi:MAG: hypothetical protein Kow0022_14520 [Phycisphaerales bacterium]